MKISVGEDREIILEEVFSGVGFRTSDGEFLAVCMRDSGFEISYGGRLYSLQNGDISDAKEFALLGGPSETAALGTA